MARQQTQPAPQPDVQLELRIVLDLPPQSWRPMRFGKRGKHPDREYGPWRSAATAQAALQLAAARARGEWPRDPYPGVVEVEVLLVRERTKALAAKKYPDGRFRCGVKPDFDNCAKAAIDAVARGGVLVDDGQVSDAVVRKRYAARGERPHVEVVLRSVDPLGE